MARRRRNPNRKTQNLRKQATTAAQPPEDTAVRVFVYQTTRRKERYNAVQTSNQEASTGPGRN